MRLSTIEELALQADLTYDRPIAELVAIRSDCRSLPELLAALEVQIDVLQTPEAVERASYELAEDFAADGIIHGEVRFAPHLLQRSGSQIDEIILAAHRGLRRAESDYGLSTSLIVCALRHRDPQEGLELVAAATRLPNKVHGLDLAGPEAGFPAEPFRAAFDEATATGLGITVHAGEADGPTSVRQALDLGATRIGHGVRSVEDADLVAELATHQVTLECAPTCNVFTLAVPSMSEHPIDMLHEAGVPITVNTDVRTCLSITLVDELKTIGQTFGWDRQRHVECQLDAARAAFVSEVRRAELISAIQASAAQPNS